MMILVVHRNDHDSDHDFDHDSDDSRHDNFVFQASGPGQAQYRREGPLQGSFKIFNHFDFLAPAVNIEYIVMTHQN